MASTGMVCTPLGNAVALRPSIAERAPMPPLLNISISALRPFGLLSSGRTLRCRFHKALAPSAGTLPGRHLCSAPSTRSGTK
ncbi:hypothetical protein D3C75_980180 [compost metagenome]